MLISSDRKERQGSCARARGVRKSYLQPGYPLAVCLFIGACLSCWEPDEGETLAVLVAGAVLLAEALHQTGAPRSRISLSADPPGSLLGHRRVLRSGGRKRGEHAERLTVAGKGRSVDLLSQDLTSGLTTASDSPPLHHEQRLFGPDPSFVGVAEIDQDDRRRRAIGVLEAAFTQLAQYHPDAYETANVRGLIKWWEDPYILIFLAMSFGSLVAMGIWCIIASYK